MATRKNAKSSKTAHVLNVLSNHTAEPEDPSAADTAPATGEMPRPVNQSARPLVPPVLEVARANDDALSEKIQDALSQELEAEVSSEAEPESLSQPPEEVPAPDLTDEPPAHSQTEPPAEVPSSPPENEPAACTSCVPGSSEPRPGCTTSAAMLPGDLVYVNIMQALVEEKAKKYMDMFGLCTCSRCVADVKALALTNLPPKYMVMQKGECIPMLTVFENQFNAALIAQIIAACRVVLQNPRHNL